MHILLLFWFSYTQDSYFVANSLVLISIQQDKCICYMTGENPISSTDWPNLSCP